MHIISCCRPCNKPEGKAALKRGGQRQHKGEHNRRDFFGLVFALLIFKNPFVPRK